MEDNAQPQTADEATPVELFIRGLTRGTTHTQFVGHFCKYGEITKSKLMRDGRSGKYGFITYVDPSVADKVIEDTHIINGSQVIVKRTREGMDIFVGRIPETMTEDELRDLFKWYGEVEKYMIIRRPFTNRSRRFGFISFASEEIAEQLLATKNNIKFRKTLLNIEIAYGRITKTNPPPPSSCGFGGNRSGGPYGGGYGSGYDGAYDGYGRGYGIAHGRGYERGYHGAYGGYGTGYGGAHGGYRCGYGCAMGVCTGYPCIGLHGGSLHRVYHVGGYGANLSGRFVGRYGHGANQSGAYCLLHCEP